MKHPARVPSQLSESVREQLNAYALAATAAGVGMLALAQPAEGKIVYTEAQIDCSKLCHLDVNNDGRPDFILSNGPGSGTSCGYTTALLVSGASFGESHSYRNAVVGKRKSYQRPTSALRAGVLIRTATESGGGMALRDQHFCSNSTTFQWPWANAGKGVRNRYLGLKIYINGKAHYGWARLDVSVSSGIRAKVTGYAYETIPNKPIIAGKTHGNDTATLGRLAQGASDISAWRQKP